MIIHRGFPTRKTFFLVGCSINGSLEKIPNTTSISYKYRNIVNDLIIHGNVTNFDALYAFMLTQYAVFHKIRAVGK